MEICEQLGDWQILNNPNTKFSIFFESFKGAKLAQNELNLLNTRSVFLKIQVFGAVTLFGLVNSCRRFEPIQKATLLEFIDAEEQGITILQKRRYLLPVRTAEHSRSLKYNVIYIKVSIRTSHRRPIASAKRPTENALQEDKRRLVCESSEVHKHTACSIVLPRFQRNPQPSYYPKRGESGSF